MWISAGVGGYDFEKLFWIIRHSGGLTAVLVVGIDKSVGNFAGDLN